MADHIAYCCVAYRYMTGWEGVVTDTLATPDDDVAVPGATSLGTDRTIVALVAAALDYDSATFSGSSSWDASDAGITGESFHIWTQDDTGHGGGIYSGAAERAAAGASGTWSSSIADALPQALASLALYGTQFPEVYDMTKGGGVDAVSMPMPMYGGGFYIVAYIQTANEEIEIPAGWTEIAAIGHGTPGDADATRLTIIAIDADDSPGTATLNIIAGGDPEEIDASLSGAAPAPTMTGGGDVAVAGALAGAAPTPTMTGAGAAAVVGELVGAAPAPAMTGVAAVAAVADLAGTAPTPTMTGAASVADGVPNEVDASLAGSAPVPSMAGAGSVAVVGSHTGAAPIPTATSAASVAVTGGLAGVAPTPTMTGSGAVSVVVALAGAAPSPTMAGAAGIPVAGTLAGTAPTPAMSGAAYAGAPPPIEASLDGAAPVPTLVGAGDVAVGVVLAGAAPVPTMTALALVGTVGYVGPRNATVQLATPTVGAELATPTITARWE